MDLHDVVSKVVLEVVSEITPECLPKAPKENERDKLGLLVSHKFTVNQEQWEKDYVPDVVLSCHNLVEYYEGPCLDGHYEEQIIVKKDADRYH